MAYNKLPYICKKKSLVKSSYFQFSDSKFSDGADIGIGFTYTVSFSVYELKIWARHNTLTQCSTRDGDDASAHKRFTSRDLSHHLHFVRHLSTLIHFTTQLTGTPFFT